MSFSIRNATAEDVPAMHRLRCAVRENRLSDPARVIEATYHPYVAGGSAWVAEADGRIAGFAVLDAAAISVWALFVDPQAEGAGIARGLHARMLGWAQEQGIETLTLTTEPGTRAARFYSRAGWTEAGRNASGEIVFERKLRP